MLEQNGDSLYCILFLLQFSLCVRWCKESHSKDQVNITTTQVIILQERV